MKKVVEKVVISMLMVGVLVTGTVCVASAKSTELEVSGEALFSQGDDWDNGYGVSSRAIFWNESGLGVALSIGVQKWGLNDQTTSDSEDFGYGYTYDFVQKISGDATMIPLGVSGLYEIPVNQIVNFTLEGGIRYVIVDSNIKYDETFTYTDGYWGGSYSDSDSYDVDIDNGVVGVLGAKFDVEVSEGFRVFAGAGYQFDMIKGDVSINGYDIAENELKAAFIRAGLAWKF